MDINDFIPKKPESTPIIQKDIDSAKYDEVAGKLCEKRRAIEMEFKTELTEEVREEKALDLLQLKVSMATFGITEIDYQAYLAYREKEMPESDQLQLF